MPSSVINAKKNKENNRIGKTRDLFKKIKDTQGTFHAKMGSIKEKWYGPNDMRKEKESGKSVESTGWERHGNLHQTTSAGQEKRD